MKLTVVGNIIVLTLCLVMVNCEDDKELASIIGNWQGEEAAFRLNAIPVTSTDLDIDLEFTSDNTVIYKEETVTTTGTYGISGGKLTISGIEADKLPVSISGEYDIRELTHTRLELEGEREGEINDPTYGNISGKVKATLIFKKISG